MNPREKIKVTAQQRANAIEARDVMWPSVPPENVYPELATWSDSGKKANCGTHACFGGWCAQWSRFKAQGVYAGPTGAPRVSWSDWASDASEFLFGYDSMFAPRGSFPFSGGGVIGTDHELVTRRLNWLIENSEVV